MPTVLSPLPVPQAPPVREAPHRPAPGRRPGRGPRLTRRHARTGIPAALLAVITALAVVVLAGRSSQETRPDGQRGTSLSRTLAAGPFGLYPGRQDRGVFQTISRMTAYGSTIVTTGTEVTDGVVRQQFFFSADGGRSWQLAPIRTANGPLAADRLARARGQLPVGPLRRGRRGRHGHRGRSTAASRVSQQAVLPRATTAGAVRPVPLARIPGAVVPEVKVNSLAMAGGQQVAVGSADSYPAIWHRVAGGPWRLVSWPSLAAFAGLSTLTSVTHGTDGWLAVGVPGPVVLTSADGTTWQPAAGSIARDLSGVVGLSAAAGPGGYVIVGKEVEPDGSCEAYVFHSADLASWTRVHDVNDTGGSSQVLAVAADGVRSVIRRSVWPDAPAPRPPCTCAIPRCGCCPPHRSPAPSPRSWTGPPEAAEDLAGPTDVIVRHAVRA
jgi:hypothetical protein